MLLPATACAPLLAISSRGRPKPGNRAAPIRQAAGAAKRAIPRAPPPLLSRPSSPSCCSCPHPLPSLHPRGRCDPEGPLAMRRWAACAPRWRGPSCDVPLATLFSPSVLICRRSSAKHAIRSPIRERSIVRCVSGVSYWPCESLQRRSPSRFCPLHFSDVASYRQPGVHCAGRHRAQIASTP